MTAHQPIHRTAPQTLVQRALGGHAAIGLLACALLYIIALSGTIIVVHDRWQRWEQPGVVESGPLSPAAAQTAIAAGLALDTGKPRTTHLYIRMPTDDLPRAVVTTDNNAWYVDAAGRPVAREAHGWTEFVIALHEYLHLPLSWGMIVVGALGVVLSALVVTGVLAHPRILRDAFRLRTRHDGQIALADWHNRLGVWSMPFVLAVALTGAFIGLGSVGFTVLAKTYTGGKLEAMYAPVFGSEPAPNPAGAPLPDIATALRTLAARVPGAEPTYVIVHEPGTRGQHVQILAEHPRRLIYGENYRFGPRGEWRGPAGMSDGALGQQAAASAYNLHFGNFAGPVVEIAYMLLGLALCAVTTTGTSIWLRKRRRRGLRSERLTAAWDGIVWGTPLALIATVWLRAAAGATAPFVTVFWGLLAMGLFLAAVRPGWIGAAWLRPAVFAALTATALGHLLLLAPMPFAVVALDLVLLAGGVAGLLLQPAIRARLPRGRLTATEHGATLAR